MVHRLGSCSVFALFFIAACGGGGGSSPTPTTPQAVSPPPPPPPASQSATPTQFKDETVLREIVYDSGYTNDMNAMVRQFAGGGAVGDIDSDGDLDILIVPGNTGPNLLYLNQGGTGFVEAAAAAGLAFTKSSSETYRQSGPVFADMDSDGDLDLFLGGLENDPSQIFANDGFGNFTNVSAGSGVDFMSSIHTISAAFGDYDGDGDQDLLLVSDFGGSRVLRNDGASFADITDPTIITDTNGMGAAIGDYDADGDPDWFVSSIDGNRLYQNVGGDFAYPTEAFDVEDSGWGWGSCFADFNADGFLDIYHTNGWDTGGAASSQLYLEDTSRLWMQNADGSFEDMASQSDMLDTEQGRGVICDDFDADGDVDVLLLSLDDQQAAILWSNQLNTNNSLTVELEGKAPNTFGIGAVITATTDNSTQTRWVGVNSNFISHNSTQQYFGVGGALEIDTIQVQWPDGATTTLNSVQTNQNLTIQHPDL